MRVGRVAMRVRFEIALEEPDWDDRWLRAAGEEALDEIGAVERVLSAHDPGAELAQLNAQAGTAVVVSPVLWAFLQQAAALVDATGGAFDPTTGADPERVGFARHVTLDAAQRSVHLSQPGVRLDPGALGKGFALERAAAALSDLGVTCALLHGGTSSVRALGPRGDRTGFAVAIADPAHPASHLATVCLRDQALSVSASMRDHVLNPTTRQPAPRGRLAAVVAPSGTMAEALSTALLVRGPPAMGGWKNAFPAAAFLMAGAGTPVESCGDAFARPGRS